MKNGDRRGSYCWNGELEKTDNEKRNLMSCGCREKRRISMNCMKMRAKKQGESYGSQFEKQMEGQRRSWLTMLMRMKKCVEGGGESEKMRLKCT